MFNKNDKTHELSSKGNKFSSKGIDIRHAVKKTYFEL